MSNTLFCTRTWDHYAPAIRFSVFGCMMPLFFSLILSGCSSNQTGTIEAFVIDQERKVVKFEDTDSGPPRNPVPKFGDRIRFNSDSITLVVEDIYLQSVPPTLTGSHDVVVFCEIWESAITDESHRPLTSIIHTEKNVLIPGRLNFHGEIGYGSTNFKGYPFKVVVTVMVLQKAQADQISTGLKVAEGLANSVMPQYSMLTSTVASILRDVLAAQPDVTAFRFSLNFYSDAPQALVAISNTANMQQESPKIGSKEQAYKPYHFESHWARYGRYALIETKPRYSVSNKPDGAVDIFSQQKLPTITHERGYLWHNSGKLRASSVVFRLDPTQLPVDETMLREASAANTRLLASLRRPDEDVNTALASLDAHLSELQTTLINAKIQKLAARAAGKNNSKDSFNKFKSDLEGTVTSAFDGASNDIKAQAEKIKKTVTAEWEARYNATAAPKKVDDPINAPKNLDGQLKELSTDAKTVDHPADDFKKYESSFNKLVEEMFPGQKQTEEIKDKVKAIIENERKALLLKPEPEPRKEPDKSAGDSK